MTRERVGAANQAAFASVAIATGAVVSVALGVYGSRHAPSGGTIATFGFGNLIAMKVWLGTVAGCLALVQLGTALWMYGKLGVPAPPFVGTLHRASGALAVLVSLPVAYHCLWSLGFQSYDTRVLVHSLFGCLFYGAFVTKILTLHSESSPRWLLPAAGGVLLTVIVVVVLTSSVWYFREVGLPVTGNGY